MVIVAAIILWAYQFITSRLEIDSGSEGGGLPQSLSRVVVEPPSIQKSGNLRGGGDTKSNNDNNNQQQKITTSTAGGLKHFTKLAQDLAALPPSETLYQLETTDPFGVRTFDKQLLEHETTLGRVLTMNEIQELFPCPINNEERITLPDVRVEQKALDFRNGKRGTFLFFQHLRKAGGTNFCSLAEKNLPKKAQPRYYCMPDMGWSGNKNAGYCKSFMYLFFFYDCDYDDV